MKRRTFMAVVSAVIAACCGLRSRRVSASEHIPTMRRWMRFDTDWMREGEPHITGVTNVRVIAQGVPAWLVRCRWSGGYELIDVCKDISPRAIYQAVGTANDVFDDNPPMHLSREDVQRIAKQVGLLAFKD